MSSIDPRPALRLITGALHDAPVVEWAWFCGHCAAPPQIDTAPAPTARVCPSCGLGLLLEAPRDAVPSPRESFLVIDSALLVQAVSRRAERLLGVREDTVVRRPLAELLVSAGADPEATSGLALAVMDATGGEDAPRRVHVRPANTFGVRLRARVAPCGPPRASLLVLDGPQPLGTPRTTARP
jgi:hypothetical protein